MPSRIWIACGVFAVYAALLPFSFDLSLAGIEKRLLALEYLPFWDIAENEPWSIPDVVQNVLFFIPFGVVGYLARRKMIAVVCWGALLSASIEALQLLTKHRICSASDIAANSLGALMGCIGARLYLSANMGRLFNRLKRNMAAQELLYPAGVMVLLCAVTSLSPFDFSLDVSDLKRNLKYILSELAASPPTLKYEPLLFLRYAVLGAVLSELFRRMNADRAAARALAVTLFLSAGLELAQLLVASRTASVVDLAAQSLGALAGTFTWVLFRASPRRKPLLLSFLAVGSVIASVVFTLSPFQFSGAYHPMTMLPFKLYQEESVLTALSSGVQCLSTYFCLGFFLTYLRGISGRQLALILLSVLLIIILTEVSQCWIENRFADVTDILLQFAGILLGLTLGARASETTAKEKTMAPLPAADAVPLRP